MLNSGKAHNDAVCRQVSEALDATKQGRSAGSVELSCKELPVPFSSKTAKMTSRVREHLCQRVAEPGICEGEGG